VLEGLKAHLAVVKQSPADKKDEDFYSLMLKAKETLGKDNYHMTPFY
jgi:hypothetical protein